MVINKSANGDLRVEIDPNNANAELELADKIGLNLKKLVESEFTPETNNNTSNLLKLSELYQKYSDAKISDNSWNLNTQKSNRQSFELLIFILSDRKAEYVTRDYARYVFKCLQTYPVNKNKSALYKNMDMDTIIYNKPEKTISARTINKHLDNFRHMYNWGEIEGVIKFESNPFELLKVKDKTPANMKKESFSSEDLYKLFTGEIYEEHKFTAPYQFWAPLIALFTGSLIAQIASLNLKDISEIEGIWTFDFNDF